MNLVKILKKLHKKVTGIDTEAKSVNKILESFEENYSAPSGGENEPFFIIIGQNPNGTFSIPAYAYEPELLEQDIREALNSGKNIYFVVNNSYILITFMIIAENNIRLVGYEELEDPDSNVAYMRKFFLSINHNTILVSTIPYNLKS